MDEEKLVKESSLKASKLIFIICALVYACAYIARGNYSVVVDLMKKGSVIDDNIAGLISATYFICYTIGQFVNGFIADRKSPFVMVIIGVSIIIFSSLAMVLFCNLAFVMILWWGLNGIGQSMLWSPIFYLLNNGLNKKIRFKAITLMSLTTPLGKIASYFFSALSLNITDSKWQSVFVMAAIIMVIMLALWITTNIGVRRLMVYDNGEPKKNEKKDGFSKLFITTGLFLIIPAMIVHGLFLNGTTEWVPTMIQNKYGVSSALSGYLMMIVPAIGVLGVFICNFVYQKIFRKNEAYTGLFFMTISLLLVGLLFLIAKIYTSLVNPVLLCAIFIFIYGLIYTAQLGFNHLSVTLVPMHFVALGFASTASGVLNALNYGGSAISTYAISFLVSNMDLLFTVWLISLVVAIISLFIFERKWHKFSKETPII